MTHLNMHLDCGTGQVHHMKGARVQKELSSAPRGHLVGVMSWVAVGAGSLIGCNLQMDSDLVKAVHSNPNRATITHDRFIDKQTKGKNLNTNRNDPKEQMQRTMITKFIN